MANLLSILYTFPSQEVHVYFCKKGASCRTLYLCSITLRTLLMQLQELQALYHSPFGHHGTSSEPFSFALCAEDSYILDADSTRLVDEIHECLLQLRRRGVSLRTVREALQSRQHVSPLVITPDFRIILPDYNHQEIILPPLPKALYFLYLRHPEGIPFKHLADYRDELLAIYGQLSPRSNPARRIRLVDTLVDPSQNSINEKASIIRRAFYSVLDEHLAAHYVISGEKGEVRRVLQSTIIDCQCFPVSFG